MAFGLSKGPAKYEGTIDAGFLLAVDVLLCYLDEDVVFSTYFSEHINCLSTGFACLS